MTLVVGIVLARKLDPKVYGSIALVTVFTTLLQVFVDSGLGTALIQKKNADDIDFSSVFWFNLVACIFLYCLMFMFAPLIALYYDRNDLIPVIRVLSLILVISGVKNIQQAYISRNLMFKKFFFATLGGTICAAILGIWMAYHGFGVWALVAQYLLNGLVDTFILWITVKWRPKFVFSFERFKSLFSYGWKMLVSGLIDTVYNELRTIIIGKYYSSEDLAFYSKGSQYPKYAVDNINSTMNSILLPVLSQKQDDLIAVKSATRRVIKLSSFVIWPMMIGLCVTAENFINVLLTEKWLPATFFMRVICIGTAFQPLQTTNLSVIKALGQAGIHLKIELIKKSIAITIVIVSAFFGVEAIAIGSVIYALIATIINSYPNRKLIDYSYIEQIKDIMPFVIMSCIMGICVYFVGLLSLKPFLTLMLQIICGVVIYLLCSVISRVEALYTLKEVLMDLLHMRTEKN